MTCPGCGAPDDQGCYLDCPETRPEPKRTWRCLECPRLYLMNDAEALEHLSHFAHKLGLLK